MADLMELFPLREVDQWDWQSFDQKYSEMECRGLLVDGLVNTAINEGVGCGFMTVTTHGRKEFIMYNVYVMKIRRETFALEAWSRKDRLQWCRMAQAFIDHFGRRNTPPDIIACLADVREVFGVDD